jgi:hypothetical protein
MKFIFNETGEIVDYEYVLVEGVPAVLVTRQRGTPEVFARYYNPDVIDIGVSKGVFDLIEESEDEQEGNGMV